MRLRSDPRTLVRTLLSLLTKSERRQLITLLPIMIVMAVVQVVGIASILPFLQLVGNPSAMHDNALLSRVHGWFGSPRETSFLFLLGVLAFVTLALSNAFGAYTTWRINAYSHLQAHRLALRLLDTYVHRPYTFFLTRNASDLSKRILAEVQQVVSGILMPGLQMISRVMATLLIFAFLIVINPLLAVAAALVLGGAYAGIYAGVRRTLARIGRENVTAHRGRYQFTYEALHGIKEAKILGKASDFVEQFARPSERAARNSALSNVISSLPRYALEVIAFGGIVLIVLYLLAAREGLGQALPLIGVYAFASYRLMPALQEIFSALTKIRFNVAALESLHEDARLTDTAATQSASTAPATSAPSNPGPSATAPVKLREALELRNVWFAYPDAPEPTLRDVGLTVRAKSVVALVGATGSGKTTTVDILLGLLDPSAGALLVDGVVIDEANVASWQRNLGYVPQHIYLSDASIARNIAFGVPEHDIDLTAVERAAQVANLDAFVTNELPNGYRTLVGDRGVRLSGGQRQRIGIARALYRDPDVLVLDEATSALDGVTEENVFQGVQALAQTKTIIMIAHRLSTVRHCDAIYVFDAGRVVARGTYHELIATSATFRSMAQAGDDRDPPARAAPLVGAERGGIREASMARHRP